MRRLVSCLFVLLLFFFPGCAEDVVDEQAPDGGPFAQANSCGYVENHCRKLKVGERLPDDIKECIEIDTSGTYDGDFVHITDGGRLYIDDIPDLHVTLRVKSMLVEYGGIFQAGAPGCPFGQKRGTLTIALWGADPTNQGEKEATAADGINCVKTSNGHPCFPDNVKPAMVQTEEGTYCTGDPTNADSKDTCTGKKSDVKDASDVVHGPDRKNYRLEHYDNPPFDASPFGYKVLAVSYGGALRLFGAKGVQADASGLEGEGGHCAVPAKTSLDTAEMQEWANLSGASWARMAKYETNAAGQTWITLDRNVGDAWAAGDKIVVGTTDWYPSHNEEREIDEVENADENGLPSGNPDGGPQGAKGPTMLRIKPLRWPHQTSMLDITKTGATFTGTPKRTAADLRAPVGLLSRSIKIQSLGEDKDKPFKTATECAITDAKGTPDKSCYFGGHVMVRQGFRDAQLSGVELHQLGQGGRQGHYPIHFHLAKSTAYTQGRAFVKDSSIWDSMTRFAVLHGTQGVTLSRNVGWLSVGHGFYGEDGSEIENKLCHNLALEARAPLVEYFQAQKKLETNEAKLATARFIPPILDGAGDDFKVRFPGPKMKVGSDALMPSMFWTMNAYNEVVGNQASGVHGFGACYWLLGSALSGVSKFMHQFDGIAAANNGNTMAPLYRFRGNACSTATYSLMSTADPPPGASRTGYEEVKNPYFDAAQKQGKLIIDRPALTGSFRPIVPNAPSDGCPSVADDGKDLGNNEGTCLTTVIDRYTTSFNWAQVNFSSVWLRPWWYYVTNSAITDQLAAGLTFISAGSWIQVPPTYFSLVENSLFAGTTQFEGSPYAARSGPIFHVTKDNTTMASPTSNLTYTPCTMGDSITCNFPEEGTGVFQNEFNPKRLLNIYDGPAYAKGNTFVSVGSWECDPQPCAGAKSVQECLDRLPCSLDSTNAETTSGTCKKDLPCGIYGFTRQPHKNDNVPDGVPVDGPDAHSMIVADAAIGWKQPNGFYYPPAFAHEEEIFYTHPPALRGKATKLNGLDQCWTSVDGGKTFGFLPGDCRHNAIDRMRTYVLGDKVAMQGIPNFARPSEKTPLRRLSASPVDFQTILLDIDGTLTGATAKLQSTNGFLDKPQPTTSVSRNAFFDAPKQTDECLSYGVQTSPYQYVSTMLGRVKTTAGNKMALDALTDDWGAFIDMTGKKNPGAPMIAIYRQWRLANDSATCENVCDKDAPTAYGCSRASFMMGPNVGQSVHLTMSPPRGMPTIGGSGFYYIDTNSGAQSKACVEALVGSNVPAPFKSGTSYVVYNMFPRNDSSISYTFYVGKSGGTTTRTELLPKLVKVNPHRKPAGDDDYASMVTVACDATTDGSCDGALDTSKLATQGLITITLDHAKHKGEFTTAKRTSKEQCLTRDLCRFDTGTNTCVSCFDPATGKSSDSCTRKNNEGLLAVDAKALAKDIDDYCLWSTRSTGTVKNDEGEISLADCPEGGCLGFMFTLPSGFEPKKYVEVFPSNTAVACFDETAWTKNELVTRKKDGALVDPTCGELTSPIVMCK